MNRDCIFNIMLVKFGIGGMLALGEGDEQRLIVTAEQQLKDKAIVNSVGLSKSK